MATDDRWAARTGWDLTAERVAKSPDGLALPALLDRIESEMASADPEVQWTMNMTLATIGIHPATLYELGCILRARSALFESRRVFKQALALESHDDIRECLADVERAIRLQSPAGGRPKKLPPTSE